MKIVYSRFCGLVFVTALACVALLQSGSAQDDQFGGFTEKLKELLPGMASEDLGAREKAQQTFQTMCWRAGRPGAESEREAICRAMLPALGPETPKPAREWLIRQLRYIGRAECAEALAALLDDADLEIREHARMALQGNPSEKAAEVLCAALAKAQDAEFKAALINALAGRQDQIARDTLLKYALAEEDVVRAAALRALALSGEERAAEPMKAAAGKGDAQIQALTADARLLLADRLCAEGKTEAGEKIYRDVLVSAKGPARGAAFIGLARAGGKAALEKMTAELGEEAASDKVLFQAIMAEMDKLPPDFALNMIMRRVELAEPLEKAALFKLLAAHAGKQAIPVLLKGTESEEMETRVSALESLGIAGDETVISVLAEAAGSVERAEKDAARASLARLKGEKVESALLAMAEDASESPGIRCEIIRALCARRAAGAGATLLKAAKDRDSEVRIAALRGLAELAEASDVPALLELLKSASGEEERNAAVSGIMAACRKDETGRTTETVLAEIEKAEKGPKLALIRGLSNLGTEKALAVVRKALSAADADEKDAAVRAMADWQDATPREDLLAIARDSKNDVHRVLALDGYIRMLGACKDMPRPELCELYEAAWDLAERDEERKLILGHLAKLPDLKSLEFVKNIIEEINLMGEDEVLPEAETAYVEIAIGLKNSKPAEAKAALQQFCGSSKDEALIKRAVEIIQSLE